jgi:Putative threonine efflux protein
MKNTKSIQWWMSWPVIIIALILFWPVGLIILIARMSADRGAIVKNTNNIIVMVIGALLLVGGLGTGLSALMSMILFSFGMSSMLFAIFMIAGGAYMVWAGWKNYKKGERYRNYINHIVNRNITSMEEIAAIENVSYETVKDELQTMIDAGYFQGKLDLEKRQIRLNNTPKNPESGKVTHCPSCGANNIIQEYDRTECEYCGTNL